MKYILTIVFIFAIAESYSQLASPQIIAPLINSKVSHGDINADGFTDIIGKTSDNQLTWIKNEGEGVFVNPRLISELTNVVSYVLVDIDNDNDMDVVLSTGDKKIHYFINLDGQGSYSESQLIDDDLSQLCGNSLAISDFNNDGFTDILYSHNCDTGIGWYQNLGNGFSDFISINDDINLQELLFPADYDLDGDIDFISVSNTTFTYFENLGGNANFAEPIETEIDGGVRRDFEVTDVNGDGYPDIIFALATTNTIAWKENLGDGSFSASQDLITGNEPRDLSVADIDGDGDMDIVACLYINNLLVWFDNLDGLGNFSNPIEISAGNNAIEYFTVNLVDFDNDADADVLVGSFYDELVGWLEFDETSGTYDDITILSASGSDTHIGIAELDGNPGEDIVLTNSYGLIYMKNLDGNHHYSTQEVLLTKASFTKLADMNGDGHIDIIARDSIQNPNNPNGIIGYKMIWLENSGQGDFTTVHVINTGEFIFQAVADIDLDGDLDIIAKPAFLSSPLMLLENIDGMGNFGPPVEIVNNISAASVYLKDLNGDGFPELIYNRNSPTEIVYHLNQENNSFESAAQIITETTGFEDAFIAIDFDFDNDIDITYMNKNDDFVWYENDGLGNFSTAITIIEDGWQPGVFALHDIDSDNDMDLVYHVSGYPHFMWHSQVAPGIFDGEGKEVSGVSNVNSFHFVDVENDGDIDIFTNNHDNPVFFENYINNPVIKGSIFWDANENGIKDSTEIGLYQQKAITKPTAIQSFTTLDGNFSMAVDPGEIELSCITSLGWGFSTDSIVTILAPQSNDTIIQNFGLIVMDSTVQIAGDLTSAPTRCAFDVPFWLTYENQGATFMDGQVHVVFDSLFSDSLIVFNTVSPTPDSIVGHHVYWTFEDLAPTQAEQISFSLTIPGPDFIGDTLLIDGIVSVIDGNQDTIFTDSLAFLSEINCSYDPNDKLVQPSFEGYDNYTLFHDTITYTIRFQNTGTDTAFNVRITDLLDEHLDLSTVRIVSTSHPVETLIESNRRINFSFNDILLPPVIQNEPLSHGFVKFTILPSEDANSNTLVNNTANIYFDFNPPIITNTVTSVLVNKYPIFYNSTSPRCHDSNEGSITVNFPPSSFNFLWSDGSVSTSRDSLVEGNYFLEIYNQYGELVADNAIFITAPDELTSTQIITTPSTIGVNNGTATTQAFGGTPSYSYNWGSTPPQTTQLATNLASGEYQVTITDSNECSTTKSFIIESVVANNELPANWLFNVSPNPSMGKTIIAYNLPNASNWDIRIFNEIGQEVTTFSSETQKNHSGNLLVDFLSTGAYFVHFEVDNYRIVKKLLVVLE